MVSKLPRNHYVHVYLEEVFTASNVANVEPEINVEVSDTGSFEPEINVEVNDVAGSFEPDINVEVSDVAGSFELDFNVKVSDDNSLEENIGEPSEIRVESSSDSENIDYEASKSSTRDSSFTDSDSKASNVVSDVHARVGDKVMVSIDDTNGHSDSLHSVGIPCIHAIFVILLLEEKPESYVDPCYSVSTQMAIYSHFITLLRGENQWTRQHGMDENVLPPILRRPSGRPHKKRRREADEVPSQGCKIRRPSQPTLHQDQSNITRPSQPLPPPYTVRWMPTIIVFFTQEAHTATPNQSGIHPQINIPRPSQPLYPPPPFHLLKRVPSLNHLHKILLERGLGVTLDFAGIAKMVF
ncbi:hypothetical protein V6N13_063720 [Hibiscus sabdariffa]